MKSLSQYLSAYKSYHLNEHNIKTHVIGVPVIIFSIFIALGWIRFEAFGFDVTGAWIFIAASLIFYCMLNFWMASAIALFAIPMNLWADHLAQLPFTQSLVLGVVLFVVGWLIQFIGHKFEGIKPAFVDDINSFMIAPLFLIAELFFLLGFFKNLEEQVLSEGNRLRANMARSAT